MERDIELNPYTVDEKRVADYLESRSVGASDPIGFLIASHASAMDRLETIRQAAVKAQEIIGE